MFKKSCFRGPFNRKHGKWVETLLKSVRQHLYEIYWSFWRQLSWKKSLLVICKMSGLLVNALAVGDKYSLLNSDNLTQSIHMPLSRKKNFFDQYFSAFLKSRLNFAHCQNNKSHAAKIFRKLGLWLTYLDKCLKSPVSEVLSKSNMANQPKHCWNLPDSTFIWFIDNFEGNSVAKSLSSGYEKSEDCLLIDWLQMSNVYFLIGTI